ncbi:MAG: hypothetical protein JSV19_04315 [Phycisphaerales bacterium]|nr:MAG: hypothetical protein JSV19_04315 [Phycisphaerales bacterium]
MQAHRFILPAAIVLAAAIVGCGETRTQSRVEMVMRANAFEVVDDQGVPRVVLRMSADGSPTIELRDKSGKARGEFKLSPDGSPSINLLDKNGEVCGEFMVAVGDKPVIYFYDKSEQPIWLTPATGDIRIPTWAAP